MVADRNYTHKSQSFFESLRDPPRADVKDIYRLRSPHTSELRTEKDLSHQGEHRTKTEMFLASRSTSANVMCDPKEVAISLN